jgi:hypothetical protein
MRGKPCPRGQYARLPGSAAAKLHLVFGLFKSRSLGFLLSCQQYLWITLLVTCLESLKSRMFSGLAKKD